MDWNEKVKEALSRTEFMALSTVGSDGSWTCPVQYGYSEKLNLYFVSMMHSKHVKNILDDGRVSAAIFKTERFPGADGDVLGLQLSGVATHLKEKSDIEKAVSFWGHEPQKEWNFFKIVPEELWCFDSRVFGEERKHVDLNILDLR